MSDKAIYTVNELAVMFGRDADTIRDALATEELRKFDARRTTWYEPKAVEILTEKGFSRVDG